MSAAADLGICALKALRSFIYNYQTLLTGIGAIGAAYWASRPVWAQLALTRTQADGVRYDMLSTRQAAVERAYSALAEQIGKRLNALQWAMWEADNERLSEQAAFHHDSELSSALSWLRLDYKWRDTAETEKAKQALVEKLDALLNTLDDIHRPAHTEQHDEDHSFTDDEWAAFLARGEAAKGEASGRVDEATAAFSQLLTALRNESNEISQRLKAIDRSIMA